MQGRPAVAAFVVLATCSVPELMAQRPATDGLLDRRYREGDRFGYVMTGRDDNDT